MASIVGPLEQVAGDISSKIWNFKLTLAKCHNINTGKMGQGISTIYTYNYAAVSISSIFDILANQY